MFLYAASRGAYAFIRIPVTIRSQEKRELIEIRSNLYEINGCLFEK